MGDGGHTIKKKPNESKKGVGAPLALDSIDDSI